MRAIVPLSEPTLRARELADQRRRDGRVVEGAPLLRAYGSKAHRGFESLSLRHVGRENYENCIDNAPVAQLDRAHGYEP
jgi:hypothetical protein